MENLNKKASAIFYRALDHGTDSLASFLDRECAGNTELRSLVEELLQTDQQSFHLLDRPIMEHGKPSETWKLRDEPSSSDPKWSGTNTQRIGSKSSPGESNKRSEETPEISGYEIFEELGRGGMAVVYRARQIKANRFVALKMIRTGSHARKEELQRFRTEAEALARLQHPGIVQIFDVGEYQDKPFFSLELCTEGNLDRYLTGTPLKARQAAELLLGLSRAVHAAHEAKIIHRDLKPANVLLTPRSLDAQMKSGDSHPSLESLAAKVTDFGLAKKLDDVGQTHSGMIMGTPSYMSPEQARGNKDVGVRSDVYSLGAILYQCLTGRPPFKAASSAETLLQVIHEEPVAPRQMQAAVPRDLETVLLKAIDKDPNRRYQSADALADDLRRFLDGEPVAARRISPMERWLKWTTRHPAAAALYVLAPVVLMLALLGGGATWLWQRAETAKTQEQASRSLAEQREKQAEAEREKARSAQKKAESAKRIADVAKEEALAANAKAEKALYFNRVVRAQFEWSNNRVGQAKRLLNECPKQFRDWEWYYLHHLCNTELFTLEGHKFHVKQVAFSPDGNLLVSGAGNPAPQLILWDTKSGKKLRTIDDMKVQLHALCFSPDGKLIARAGFGSPGLRIFDAESGKPVLSLPGQISVCFSPNSKHFVTGAEGKTATVWDVKTGKPLRTIQHSGQVADVAYSPDGKWVASTNGKKVRIWEAGSGDEKWTLEGHTRGVHHLCFSPNGNRLATASEDQTLKVWDMSTGRELLTIRGHLDRLSDVCFSPDGEIIAGSSSDTTVRLWDSQNGQEIRTYRGHTGTVLGLAYSPDGKQIASASSDGTVKIWDASHAQQSRTCPEIPAGVHGLCFSPDSKRLAGGEASKVTIWNTQDLTRIDTVRQKDRVVGVSFNKSGTLLAAASTELVVRNAKTLERIHRLQGHKRFVWDARFSPDGKRLASAGGEDRTVKVWSTQTGKIVHTLDCRQRLVSQVCFSPDGKHIASAGHRENAVQIRDAATGELVRTIPLIMSPRSLRYSPDGKRIAVGGGHKVSLLDAETGRQIYTCKGHLGRVMCICFSPDGRRLASTGQDRTIRIWDVKTGDQTLVLTGHRQSVNAVCFSPDGKHLASSDGAIGSPGVIKIWDAPGYVPKR